MAGSEHSHHHNHGNPEDFADYVARMEEPGRAEWQKPDEVLRALGIKKGQTVCDVGAGPGYFALRFAKAVGEDGHVYAVDVELKMLEVLRERITASGLRNVTPVLSLPDHSLLADGACDLIVIVDTFHHFPDGVAYLQRLSLALKPGGRLVNIDFHKKDLPLGPPPDMKISRDEFVRLAARANLSVVAEPTFLPYQYFLVMQPR